MTILVVDDHLSFRDTARQLLESEGYLVVGEAGDGMEALRAAAELEPDLVLLDVNLPDIDGFDVAARITIDEGAPAVVLISSREGADFGPLIRRSGARGFIAKADLSGSAIEELLACG
jgi:CheY-like chemotaxis protein